MKTIVTLAYKGGTGKSTIARGLGTTLAFYKTSTGLPLVPVVILADILAQSPQAKSLLGALFPSEKSAARYMPGRGFYIALRSRAPAFIRGALEAGLVKPEQLVLIADTGAQLVLDAAKSYGSADAFLIPYMRSDMSDGVPKLIDTLTHIQHTAGLDQAPDRSMLERTHIVLNRLDTDPDRRARQLEKPDYRALRANPVISSRLLQHGIPDLLSIADNADLGVTPGPHGLKHVLRAFSPVVEELVGRLGWTDIEAALPISASETRVVLKSDDRNVLA